MYNPQTVISDMSVVLCRAKCALSGEYTGIKEKGSCRKRVSEGFVCGPSNRRRGKALECGTTLSRPLPVSQVAFQMALSTQTLAALDFFLMVAVHVICSSRHIGGRDLGKRQLWRPLASADAIQTELAMRVGEMGAEEESGALVSGRLMVTYMYTSRDKRTTFPLPSTYKIYHPALPPPPPSARTPSCGPY